jgi:microcystin-dependent protein
LLPEFRNRGMHFAAFFFAGAGAETRRSSMNRLLATAALSALGFLCIGPASAQEPFIGEVRLLGFNFCPTGWIVANGQLLNIAQFQALFALYGTTYGGNGVQNFAIPNLQGRAPVGADPQQPLGAPFGASTVTLTMANLPPHRHQLFGSSTTGNVGSPSGALLGTLGGKDYAPAGSPADTAMSANAIGLTGNATPVSTQSPSLSMTWCVALQGIFPSRP